MQDMDRKTYERAGYFVWVILGVLIGSLFAVVVNAQEVITDYPDLIFTNPTTTNEQQNIPEETTQTGTEVFTTRLSINASGIELAEIPSLQEEFYIEKGEYQQVKGLVHVYESPQGWGYQTIEDLGDRVIYVGYGANAQDYTYTFEQNIISNDLEYKRAEDVKIKVKAISNGIFVCTSDM